MWSGKRISGDINAFEAKHFSQTDILGKDFNEQIENSSFPAKTPALEYTSSEVTSGCTNLALGNKSILVPFIFQERNMRKSTEEKEDIFFYKSSGETMQTLSHSSSSTIQCG